MLTFAKYNNNSQIWNEVSVADNSLPTEMDSFTEIGALLAFRSFGTDVLFDQVSTARETYEKLAGKCKEAAKGVLKGIVAMEDAAKLEAKRDKAFANYKALGTKMDTFIEWCNDNVPTETENVPITRADMVVCIAFNPWLGKIVSLTNDSKALYNTVMDYFKTYRESDRWDNDRKQTYEDIKAALLKQANSVRASEWKSLTSKNATLFLDSLKKGIKVENGKGGLTITEKRDNESSFMTTLFLWLVAVNGGYNELSAQKSTKRKLQKINF